MKNNKIIIFSIVLLSIVAISLVIFMIMVINGKNKFPEFQVIGRTNSKLAIDEKYNAEFNSININSNSSDIYVKKSESSEVRVLIYTEDSPIVETTDDELNIKLDMQKHKFFNFYTTISKIEVYIPENFDKKIKINNDYGNIEVDEFFYASIKIIEDCGNVSVKGGNDVSIENNYGDIVLDKANNVDIKQSAGDVIIGNVKNIKAENDYGDIKIDEVTEQLNIEENCGDVEIEKINLIKNSNINNSFGDIEIDSTNEIYIEAKTDLGDVEVNNNYRDAEIILKLNNNCGDITINN